MLPKQLADWTVQVVLDLLRTGMFESELFDYKVTLPHAKDDGGKDRLRRSCCAFANSDGGFLVFGISDDKTKSPESRLVGLDNHLDFPEQFGNYPHTCSPSINWDFQNPPLSLESGRVLHVVYIPKSWIGPHAQGSPTTGWRFAKRTNKGDEDMAIEEVRSAFLGYYEKRLKLQLLRSELTSLREAAAGACIVEEDRIGTHYSLESFDTRVIESVIGDTYSITAGYPDLLTLLSRIRHTTKIANNKIRIFFGKVQLPLTNLSQEIRGHNEFMRPKCEEIMALCEKGVDSLKQILGNA
jgi:hypothetical protein